jgi:indolepyruvate ferredoxin oxidoreductase beta subunit
MDKFEILVAGTGGQGVLVLGGLLDRAARLTGFKTVIGSEIHGMAQRGGPLTSSTRIGEDVHGPIISVGCADVIISLELIEGLRHIERLSKNGWLVVAETRLPSSVMWLAGTLYQGRDEILAAMRRFTDKITALDPYKIAHQAGSIRATNLVMLGATCGAVAHFPITQESIKQAIRESFPEKLIDVNIKAFEGGMRAISQEESSEKIQSENGEG